MMHHHFMRGFLRRWFMGVLCCAFSMAIVPCSAQMDQGTITGTVQDASGGLIPGAHLTISSVDTGLTRVGSSDASGTFIFSPLKIGMYRISASAPGFETTTQENIHLDLQERLNIVLTLRPGSVAEQITVTSAPPLLQTQDGSLGQVMSTVAIDHTPLNGRNWVYIAQLTAGTDPPAVGSRGLGTGDFSANGQRSEQNNFILDGVDNNINVVDFLNGASYGVRPPPDALAEFKIQTGDYSAEFGHSAGAVVNASIKSGTNEIHGHIWEYLRNDALDARNYTALSVPKYRENQFGATLGLPITKDHLFFFGDVEANRIIYGETDGPLNVPTPLMRQGNFSELLNTNLTGESQPQLLYEPGSGGTAPLQCNSQPNVFCTGQIDTVAQALLNLFPLPNVNNGKTFQNYVITRNVQDNTFQWDTRMDWNLSSKDQAFGRFSYNHEPQYRPPVFGPILDGGTFGDDGNMVNLNEDFAGSETHIFNPGLINEFRFGYNYGRFTYFQENADTDIAPTLGLGGVPYSPSLKTGGLPEFIVSSLTNFGTIDYFPTQEGQNVYQLLDNVTKIWGSHSLKFGVDFLSIRFATSQAGAVRGNYTFNGFSTSNLSASYTGNGIADFLADQMNSATLATLSPFNDARWYRSGYFQDDWKATSRLTLNLGLRYDYTQPYREMAGRQANFIPTSSPTPGTGTGIYSLPAIDRNVALTSSFTKALAEDNITVDYVNNPSLVNAQKANFAPRVGLAFTLTPRLVIRSGFGLFYGGLENRGGGTNLAQNYPFQFSNNFSSPTCKAGYGNCVGDGITLENGFTTQIAAGLQNVISTPTLEGEGVNLQTPYAMDDNLSVEYGISSNLVATVSYVGTLGRHLQVTLFPNNAAALLRAGSNIQSVAPFPAFGTGGALTDTIATSNYNSLQSKLEKRFSSGLDFLASYTWSHSLDDAPTNLESGTLLNATNLIPFTYDYTNSLFDVRQRFTFNGYYELPFGTGRAHAIGSRVLNSIAGGWATSLMFTAQTGEPFTVTPDITGAAGISPRAILVRNPFTPGGSPDPTNPIACAPKTRNTTNWYNPCAFRNPLPGSDIASGVQVTGEANVLQYFGGKRNEVSGPGYERINMSAFKDIPTIREQLIEFRADAFNLLNTPAYGFPSIVNDGPTGGEITTAKTFQNLTPDARFFQLSLKYIY